ncbi:2-hydroxyacid dehydrogenase [Nesterenkonia cremea]|nr:D-glycerate dehydrogenase [Nesterenkonia cremea]
MRTVITGQLPASPPPPSGEFGEVRIPAPPTPLSRERLLEEVRGATAIVSTLNDRIDAEVADAAGSGLRVVANVAVGYDNIDVSALQDRGVIVTTTPGVLTDATADLTMGLLLSVTRRLGEGERLLRSRAPWTFELGFMLGTGLQGKTLGIVGLGQIGRAVAHRARAFGMNIVYTSRRRAPEQVEETCDAVHLSFEELLRTADVVSLHCPLIPQTRHLIDAQSLANMKPTAYLVNTTRGPVVDEAALAEALSAGQIAGAGLDVFEHEPEVEPRLLGCDNLVLSPHLGSATKETRNAMTQLAFDNVRAVLRGDDPLTALP